MNLKWNFIYLGFIILKSELAIFRHIQKVNFNLRCVKISVTVMKLKAFPFLKKRQRTFQKALLKLEF